MLFVVIVILVATRVWLCVKEHGCVVWSIFGSNTYVTCGTDGGFGRCIGYGSFYGGSQLVQKVTLLI